MLTLPDGRTRLRPTKRLFMSPPDTPNPSYETHGFDLTQAVGA